MCSPNVVWMLDQRRRRWANIQTTLGQWFLFDGVLPWIERLCKCWANDGDGDPALIHHDIDVLLLLQAALNPDDFRVVMGTNAIWCCNLLITTVSLWWTSLKHNMEAVYSLWTANETLIMHIFPPNDIFYDIKLTISRIGASLVICEGLVLHLYYLYYH